MCGFDQVKAARETMNQMMEAWKEIPDLTDEVSPKGMILISWMLIFSASLYQFLIETIFRLKV